MQRVELTDLERKKLSEAGRQSMNTIGWLPIETAPKDIPLIIVMYMRGNTLFVYSAYWDNDMWMALYTTDVSFGLTDIFAPTHWMPLPKPPEGE